MVNKKNSFIILLSCFIIIICVFLIFTGQTQKFVYGPTPDKTTTATPAPQSQIIIDNLPANSSVSSPLKITGQIDSSWAFEGTFPVSAYDEEGNLIIRTPASITAPDEWTTPGLKHFSVTLNFSTTAKSGFIEFRNDNASGLDENDKTYKLPVKFK